MNCIRTFSAATEAHIYQDSEIRWKFHTTIFDFTQNLSQGNKSQCFPLALHSRCVRECSTSIQHKNKDVSGSMIPTWGRLSTPNGSEEISKKPICGSVQLSCELEVVELSGAPHDSFCTVRTVADSLGVFWDLKRN